MSSEDLADRCLVHLKKGVFQTASTITPGMVAQTLGEPSLWPEIREALLVLCDRGVLAFKVGIVEGDRVIEMPPEDCEAVRGLGPNPSLQGFVHPEEGERLVSAPPVMTWFQWRQPPVQGKMTPDEFELFVGRKPCLDDLDRVNCTTVGRMGHTFCGFCEQCSKPRFVCGHPFGELPPEVWHLKMWVERTLRAKGDVSETGSIQRRRLRVACRRLVEELVNCWEGVDGAYVRNLFSLAVRLGIKDLTVELKLLTLNPNAMEKLAGPTLDGLFALNCEEAVRTLPVISEYLEASDLVAILNQYVQGQGRCVSDFSKWLEAVIEDLDPTKQDVVRAFLDSMGVPPV